MCGSTNQSPVRSLARRRNNPEYDATVLNLTTALIKLSVWIWLQYARALVAFWMDAKPFGIFGGRGRIRTCNMAFKPASKPFAPLYPEYGAWSQESNLLCAHRFTIISLLRRVLVLLHTEPSIGSLTTSRSAILFSQDALSRFISCASTPGWVTLFKVAHSLDYVEQFISMLRAVSNLTLSGKFRFGGTLLFPDRHNVDWTPQRFYASTDLQLCMAIKL